MAQLRGLKDLEFIGTVFVVECQIQHRRHLVHQRGVGYTQQNGECNTGDGSG